MYQSCIRIVVLLTSGRLIRDGFLKEGEFKRGGGGGVGGGVGGDGKGAGGGKGLDPGGRRFIKKKT